MILYFSYSSIGSPSGSLKNTNCLPVQHFCIEILRLLIVRANYGYVMYFVEFHNILFDKFSYEMRIVRIA